MPYFHHPPHLTVSWVPCVPPPSGPGTQPCAALFHLLLAGEVTRILVRLQNICIGQLQVGGQPARSQMTEITKDFNELLEKLGVTKLFATLPHWALWRDKNRKPPFYWLFSKSAGSLG